MRGTYPETDVGECMHAYTGIIARIWGDGPCRCRVSWRALSSASSSLLVYANRWLPMSTMSSHNV